MNKLMIIGNLTKDPDLRTTQAGISVCSFTVAVNRRQKNADGQNEADFFRVTAWRELGENCGKWLQRGKKVAVVGPVSVSTYQGNDGKTYATAEVTAQDVEFLTPKGQTGYEDVQAAQPQQTQQQPVIDPETGYEQVENDELPF